MFNISTQQIEQHFSVLGQIGNLGSFREAGFLRASWSDEETAAMEYVKNIGWENGLRASYDGIGNLYLTTPEPRDGQEVVQVASHLDTVPLGGLFDGAAGIITGLEAILALRDTWHTFKRKLQLVIWRGEESATFGAVCKGSRAAFGRNNRNIVLKKFDGQTLGEAIRSQGFDPTLIENSTPSLSPQQIDAIAAYLELHIEQATKLEVDGNDIGIVTSVRGTRRFRFIVVGEAAHSGGTPMGLAYRKDANLAIAYMQVELDALGKQVLADGHDLVQTVGLLNSDRDYNMFNPRIHENAMTKVSPYGYFTLDIRSNNRKFLDEYAAQVQALMQKVCQRLRVFLEIVKVGALEPIEEMDHPLQLALEKSCRHLQYDYQFMPSGAIHDVAIVASQPRSDGSTIPSALVFIPCRNGISHNPKEYTTSEAMQKGAMVLAQTMYEIAS